MPTLEAIRQMIDTLIEYQQNEFPTLPIFLPIVQLELLYFIAEQLSSIASNADCIATTVIDIRYKGE